MAWYSLPRYKHCPYYHWRYKVEIEATLQSDLTSYSVRQVKLATGNICHSEAHETGPSYISTTVQSSSRKDTLIIILPEVRVLSSYFPTSLSDVPMAKTWGLPIKDLARH